MNKHLSQNRKRISGFVCNSQTFSFSMQQLCSSNKALFIETCAYKNLKMWLTWWEIIPQEDYSHGSHPGLSLLMTVQQIPLTKQQIKVELQKSIHGVRNPPKNNKEREEKSNLQYPSNWTRKLTWPQTSHSGSKQWPKKLAKCSTSTNEPKQSWTWLNTEQVKYVPKISTLVRYHMRANRPHCPSHQLLLPKLKKL